VRFEQYTVVLAQISETIANKSVSIQLAQGWFFGWLIPMLKYKYIFQIKYTEAILSNGTRKLLLFEISQMVIAVLKINLLCHLL